MPFKDGFKKGNQHLRYLLQGFVFLRRFLAGIVNPIICRTTSLSDLFFSLVLTAAKSDFIFAFSAL